MTRDRRLTEEDRGEWERRIADVVAHGGPVVALQPIVDLWRGRVAGHEALSRFSEGTPDVWFEAAHATGQGTALEIAAARAAIRVGLADPSTYLAINLCPHSVCSADIGWLAEIERPYQITLEITEHMQVDSYGALAECLAPLRAAGIRLAIDDVGAGWASFRHVLELAPDVLKLDRAIVAGVAEESAEDQRALIASMAGFAARVGCRMVAEGVETESEATTLRILGVRYGQGFFFGRPEVRIPL